MLCPNCFPLSSTVIAEWRKSSRQEEDIIFRGLKCFSNFQISVKLSNFVFITRITQNINCWFVILMRVATNGRIQMLVTDDCIGLLLKLLSGEKAWPLTYIWFLGRKMDTTMLNLRNLFEQLVRRVEILSEGNELRKSFCAALCEEGKQTSENKSETCSNLKIIFDLGYLKRKWWSLNHGQSLMDTHSKWLLFSVVLKWILFRLFFIVGVLISINRYQLYFLYHELGKICWIFKDVAFFL